LQSVQTTDGFEYLWQGDPNYWTGRSPILFPIIGGLPNETYTWRDQSYQMGSHGFARKSEFVLAEQTDHSLSFRLSDNEETKKQYPFSFDFYVIYTIRGNTLTEGFRVVNKNDDVMPFSVGGHPGFNCPMDEGKDFSDYTIIFEKPETARRRIKANKLLTGETQPFLAAESEKHLGHEWFYNDAVILHGLKSRWLDLSAGGRSVHMDFTGFPDFGIWSAANDGPYVCLEPWFGVDSTKGDSGKFEDKEGMVFLPAGETFEAAFHMTLR
jgi:galactose mutarotase-like enzyme